MTISIFLVLTIVFGVTLLYIAGSYIVPLVIACFSRDAFWVIERKVEAAAEAADLGWVALIAGPF